MAKVFNREIEEIDLVIFFPEVLKINKEDNSQISRIHSQEKTINIVNNKISNLKIEEEILTRIKILVPSKFKINQNLGIKNLNLHNN